MRAARQVNDNVNATASLLDPANPTNKSRFNGFFGQQYDAKLAAKNKKLSIAKTKDAPALKIIPVGGTDIGRNTTAICYGDEMVVVDMGFKFPGADFPGINYIVPDITWLEERKDQIKAVLFTHGHLDHIGAFHHMIPRIPAPVYGTKFTIEMLKKNMEEATGEDANFKPEYHEMNPEAHDRVQISKNFGVEFVRVNHSIPDSAAIVIRTPGGNVVMSGDWRFTPDPLDGKKFDMERLTEISAKEGIRVLVNESTDCEVPGRNDVTEKEIRMSFAKIMDDFPSSRIIVSTFSSQIHRIQSVLNEAAAHGRKVAVAGFSMINNTEIALRTGDLTVPPNTIVKLEDAVKLPDEKVVIVCTGNQGEINAVLNRMASGQHRWIKIKESDIIVLSSSRIPGNEAHIAMMEDNLIREGSDVIAKNNAEFHDIGALHASGHARHDDHVEFITALHPEFYFPNHGDFTFLVHNAEMAALECGIPKENIFVCDPGDVVEFYSDHTAARTGRIHVGNVMYDDSGAEVSDVVLKDRIHMSTEGIFTVVITVQRGTGRLLSSPDIISRGFIYLRDSEELISKIRSYVKQKVARVYSGHRVDMESFKKDLREEIAQILYDETGRSPIVIPVVNEIGNFNNREVRQAEQRHEQDEKDFQAQELARIRGGSSRNNSRPRNFNPQRPQNAGPKKAMSFGGSFTPADFAKKPTEKSTDQQPQKFPPRRADEISFRKNNGPAPMKMWKS